MSIFKLKFQAHRLVNILFYAIVFILGFVSGISIKNASAASWELDEQHIYNSFKSAYSNFDIMNAPKILCQTTNNTSTYYCYAFNDNYIDNILRSGNSNDYFISFYLNSNSIPDIDNVYFYFLELTNNSYSAAWYYIENDKLQRFGNMPNMMLSTYKTTTWTSYTNFDTTKYGLTSQQNKKNQVLDFSSYEPPLEFNENLFENDENFKKVCFKNNSKFAISRNTTSTINSKFDYDFIWFPYGLNNGLKKFAYDSASESNELHYTEEDAYLNYYFSSKEEIDKFYSTDTPRAELEIKGYKEKYKYYGYDAYPFYLYFDTEGNRFDIFNFDNPKKMTISKFGPIVEGGRFELNENNKIEDNDEDYCFYIKKEYIVTELKTNVYDDYEGIIETPNGPLDFKTTYNEDKNKEGNEFFDNFNDNDHGLSSLITMPLNTIKKMTNGTCTPINLNIMGANLELPCGDTLFWGREDVKTFKVFWNMFWGGIICYGIGISLFKLVQKLKDPNSDKVEVIDL